MENDVQTMYKGKIHLNINTIHKTMKLTNEVCSVYQIRKYFFHQS